MIWEKMMAYGHEHTTDGDVEDEISEDLKAWLSMMSGHGEEEGRDGRLGELFTLFRTIENCKDSKEHVHRLFNLAGMAAFHHDIGFRKLREKTEFQMSEAEVAEIRLQMKARMEEWEKLETLRVEALSR
jgi:hypothetical protein